MIWSTSSLLGYLVGFIAVLALVPASAVLARATGAVVQPRTDRWGHRIVPTLGGVGIAGGILAGLLLLPLQPVDRVAVILGVGAMFVLGLVDDLRGTQAMIRLGIEVLTGVAFAFAVTGDLAIHLRLAAIAVAAIAVPVAVNATNLVDNADGLAASLSLVTAGTLAAAGSMSGLASPSAALALLTGVTCFAFLIYNRPPAGVFMGDSGSLSLGFALAAASVLLVRDALLIPGTLHVATAMAVPVAWAFQFGDLMMVTITRVRRGASPFKGGVDHTSHRLLAAGVTPMVLLLGLGLCSALVGAAAAAAAAFFGGFALMAFVAVALLLLVAAFESVVAWRLPIAGPAQEQMASQQTRAGTGDYTLGIGHGEDD